MGVNITHQCSLDKALAYTMSSYVNSRETGQRTVIVE
jgi:hypothetical protein